MTTGGLDPVKNQKKIGGNCMENLTKLIELKAQKNILMQLEENIHAQKAEVVEENRKIRDEINDLEIELSIEPLYEDATKKNQLSERLRDLIHERNKLRFKRSGINSTLIEIDDLMSKINSEIIATMKKTVENI